MAKNSLVGLCPRNKFYVDDHNMETFLAKAAEISKKVYLIVPEEISTYNHIATHSHKPRKRSHRDAIQVLRCAQKAMEKISTDKFVLLDWAAIERNRVYGERLQAITESYKQDTHFHTVVNDITKPTLMQLVNTCPGRYFDDADIEIAAKYFISEMAVCDSLWSVLGWDQSEEYWFLYHTECTSIEDFLDGKYSVKPRSQMKFRCI